MKDINIHIGPKRQRCELITFAVCFAIAFLCHSYIQLFLAGIDNLYILHNHFCSGNLCGVELHEVDSMGII